MEDLSRSCRPAPPESRRICPCTDAQARELTDAAFMEWEAVRRASWQAQQRFGLALFAGADVSELQKLRLEADALKRNEEALLQLALQRLAASLGRVNDQPHRDQGCARER
jgi:hypothetical protein